MDEKVAEELVAIAWLLESTADINSENVVEATLLLERLIRRLDDNAFAPKVIA